MKRGLIIFLCLTIVASSVVWLCSKNMNASGRLVLLDLNGVNVYSFGEAIGGTKLSKSFQLYNSSNSDLKIKGVSTSCRCTVVSLVPKVLKKQESCSFEITIDLPSNGGTFAQSASIEFEGRPSVNLVIQGEVIQEFPSQIDFGEVKKGDSTPKIARIKAVGVKQRKILTVRADPAYFESKIIPGDEGNPFPGIEIKIRQDVPYGGFSKKLGFLLDGPGEQERYIMVGGTVLNPVEARIKTLTFGVLKRDEQKTQNVQIYSPYDEPVEVIKISVEPELFCKVDFKNITNEGGKITIPIVASADPAQQITKGVVKIEGRAGTQNSIVLIDWYAMFKE